MRKALVVLALAVVATLGVGTAVAAEPEPPCEVPPESVGAPSAEWCEEEIRAWEEEQAEERRQEEREIRSEERHFTGRTHVPAVDKRTAELVVGRSLRKDYPGWRRRDYGYIDCDGGRISRIHWACAVGWGTDGGRLRCGRARVTGEYIDVNDPHHTPWFRVALQTSPNWCWAAD
jgi:hypothetical protein